MTKELSNAEKLIQLEDKGAAALDNAETPEQRDSIAKNLKKMMGNFTKADRTEAAKLRAEMEGQDTDEELFPVTKSMGGRMNKDEGSLLVPPEMEQEVRESPRKKMRVNEL